MGALANAKQTLTAAVANGGTVVFSSYPAGSSQAILNGTTGGRVVVNDNDIYPQAPSGAGTVAFTYGASTITLTNNTGVTWPAGATITASFGRTDRQGVYNPAAVGQAAIVAPTGGATQDAEARAAINSLRAAVAGSGITA